MRMGSVVAAVIATAAGSVGAVAGYDSLAPTAEQRRATQVQTDQARAAQRAALATPTPSPLPRRATVVRVRFSACPQGYRVEGRSCVRREVRTVTVPDLPPGSPTYVVEPAPRPAPGPAPGPAAGPAPTTRP